jgi:glycosyltransferase involved in cell wall biosynthesis
MASQTVAPSQYEILVVDNGSTDETIAVLAQLCQVLSNLRWISEPQVGRSAARNRGIQEAKGDLIIFLDDDILVRSDHLERHVAYHSSAQVPTVVVGTVVDVSPIRPEWLRDYFHVRQLGGSPLDRGDCAGLYFATGNASLKRKTLEHVRITRNGQPTYFDPAFRVMEDVELGYRLEKADVEFIFAQDIVCQHHHVRSLETVLERSYQTGYATAHFIGKHPGAKPFLTQHLTTSPLLKHGLLASCVLLLIPTVLLRPLWREPSRKVIGGFRYYQRIRGYQHALKDLRRS